MSAYLYFPRVSCVPADMQNLQQEAGGLLRSAYGKARGLALRLSLVLEMLRWCGSESMELPPVQIGEDVFGHACDLVADYFMPMAERVYGDAAATTAERNAATLARWILRERSTEVHVRHLQREVRLPGLNTADLIHGAAAVLVEAGWLIAPIRGFGPASRVAYQVNSIVLDAPRCGGLPHTARTVPTRDTSDTSDGCEQAICPSV